MIAPLREAARAECARRHLVDFQARMDRDYTRARHLDALADHLEAVDRRDLDKLIVCLPPRHGKSRTIAQDFVAWTLGRDPSQQIILASYGAELAEHHSRRAREMISDERYPFADVQVDNTSRAADRWATNRGGLVRASGVGGSLTGFGAHLLIIDDAVKDIEAAESALIRESVWSWYSTVARTRLNARGAQVVVGTRWHDDDIIGRLLNSPGAHQWTTLIFPAIADEDDRLGRNVGEALWPQRFPLTSYPSVEAGELSSRQFSALYQQRPQSAEGSIFKRQWFEYRYDGGMPRSALPELMNPDSPFSALVQRAPRVHTIMALDAASKTGISNDFSAIVVLASDGANIFVVDVVRRRVEFTDLLQLVLETQRKWSCERLVIEEASAGVAIVQTLRAHTNLPVIGIPPRSSKVARAEAASVAFECGRVKLPKHAPWLDDFISEFLNFPVGRHDDMVDAFSYGIAALNSSAARSQSAVINSSALRNRMAR